MSLIKGWVQIVRFHLIQRCSHFMGLEYRGIPLYTEMSIFQEVGTLYTEVSSCQCWNRGVPLYIKVSSFQSVGQRGSTVYRGVLISEC